MFYNALFDVQNSDHDLRIGMTAQVTIVLGVIKNVITVPAAAIREQSADGRYAVRVLSSDGELEARQVRVGVNNRDIAEILEGLNEGEQVILGEESVTQVSH